MGIKTKKPRSSQDQGDWKTVHRWQKSFGADVEFYAVFQSRTNGLLFAATRSFVAGGFEQDYRVEHRAIDPAEAAAILRRPESFHRRMDLS
jgi:hypothetical protein